MLRITSCCQDAWYSFCPRIIGIIVYRFIWQFNRIGRQSWAIWMSKYSSNYRYHLASSFVIYKKHDLYSISFILGNFPSMDYLLLWCWWDNNNDELYCNDCHYIFLNLLSSFRNRVGVTYRMVLFHFTLELHWHDSTSFKLDGNFHDWNVRIW